MAIDSQELRSTRAISIGAAFVVAAALAAATIARLGADANGLAWALVQVLLVGLAAFDLETRRIPNAATGPAAVAVLVLRLDFAYAALAETVIAGAAATLFFLLFALKTRGLGMGDVKLAGLLGLLLGSAVVPALIVGTLAGGVASLALIARSRAWLGRTIAYGPYLCLGASTAILTFGPPPLV